MSQAERIRAVAARLKAEGYETATLERLKTVLDPEAHHRQLEAEVHQEMAFALGRTGRKLELALAALEAATVALDNAAPAADEAAALAVYTVARQAALDARRDLVIHREAIGIRDSRELADRYPHPRASDRAPMTGSPHLG
jgi:hypothetical protein